MANVINEKSKVLVLFVAIVLFVLFIAGGTFAYLYITGNVTNGAYNTGSACFVVDYDAKESSPINGILFPSSTAKGGLSGQVTMKMNSSCTTLGTGTLYLNVGTSTSDILIGKAYCINSKTLEQIFTVNGSTASSSNCSSATNGTWIDATSNTALKYAVYESGGTSPVSSGYVNTTGDIVIYNGFNITQTSKTYDIYVWLDGTMAGNEYANKSFSGYVHASATQVE